MTLLRYTRTRKTRVVAHPRRTLDRCVRGQLQLHLTLNSCLTFASSPTCLQQQTAASGRALLWVGFLACESARVRAWPQSRPRPFHFTVRQLNCTRDLLEQPAADLRLFFFSLFTHPPRSTSRPLQSTLHLSTTHTQWICSAHTSRKSRLVPVCRPFD